ncbi:hypothetical protein VBH21_03400 [Enterococcus hirae]|uniref:hypothetical protein n=1 Tax=Enterococcus hirae TaxID=1354 RepID=UPI0009BF0A66|nr:hypothetical protein [Enterococcus hirae]OQO42309.1 hypothetical protein BH758_03245 [Enterococcus hirae]OQO50474.1 hypothetical protein BH735_03640 [Enterococcus hirae]OQO61380.1 hypothetical protein BH740_03190 [Enterococcus hirae]
MNMIYKKQLKQYLKKTFKSKNCFALKILRFKKDRYVFICYNQDQYTIVEDGFEKNRYQFDSSDEAMKKVMKIADIEFKNSYRLYIQTKLKQ